MLKTSSIVMIIASVAAAAQQFEVASIKPSPPPTAGGRLRIGSRGGPGTNDPGLFTCERCGVLILLRQAFDLEDYQISGPDWMRAARFNISAKVPEGASREQFRIMLRNLMTERFKLQSHRETKEVQVYDLVVAKNGPKMKESTGPLDADERPGRLTERKLDADGFVILPPGRLPMAMMYEGRASSRHAEETMAELALSLSTEIGHPITDATGLKAKYDFTLNYIMETDGPPAADVTGPNIFRALQEQLGLKLEPKKGSVEVLVIDHIEKIPTDN
jgi:uncharacterized protein (TIGR03435 family)